MKKALLFTFISAILVVSASAQRADLAFGAGTTFSPGPSSSDVNSGNFFLPSAGGGTYLSASGQFLIRHSLGAGGEVSWKASQGLYAGYQPYRPILYDFYGIYAPRVNRHVGFEVLAGIGGEDLRFYTPYYNCNFTGCTDYVSSNHFMGTFGAGVKFYPTGGNWFIRPEVRAYLVHNNEEFNSSRIVRTGVSIGYSFGGE